MTQQTEHKSIDDGIKLLMTNGFDRLAEAVTVLLNDESLHNVTPADVYEGRRNDILDQPALVKARTMVHRKIHNLCSAALNWRSNRQKSLS